MNFTARKLAIFCTISLLGGSACAQPAATKVDTITKEKSMKIEIWSDVMCPFCYIGKRKFENALKDFSHRDDISVEWKSFQLNPDLVTDPSKNTIQHLSESKGWTMDYTRQAISHVLNMAKGVGLNYNFDKAVVANSFDAHRLIQYAKSQNKGDHMEEALFKAYFIDGKNTADHATLLSLAAEAGLDKSAAEKVLGSDAFAEDVKKDIREAEQIGVTGVPFFVINRRYAVSGAQDSQVFLQSLEKAWAESQSR